MKRGAKTSLIGVAVILGVALIVFCWLLSQALPIGTGYVAKYLYSSTSVSNRNSETVFREDVIPVNPLVGIVDYSIDHRQKAVTSDSFGLLGQTAAYREGCGCSLVVCTTAEEIGMYSALMEPDSSGTFVGSSYAVATPRDWARFGLLYLQDGVWQGERILPEGWVKYSTTPTPKAPLGEYGAHFWLNTGSASDPNTRLWPGATRDAFAAQGFQEQKLIVIPSRKLVLVRFGATTDRKAWNTDAFIKNILTCLPS